MSQYPDINDSFELTINADLRNNTPVGIVEAVSKSAKNWSYTGEPVQGEKTAKFKLVRINHHMTMGFAKEELESKYGPTPTGQWLKVFKDTFDQPNGEQIITIPDGYIVPKGWEGIIAVADNGWCHPRKCCYLCLEWKDLFFNLHNNETCASTRWLVYA